LRRQLVKFYVDQKRLMTQTREFAHLPIPDRAILSRARCRALHQHGQGTGRGAPGAAGADQCGGEVFPFQIALAELHFAEGNVNDAVQLLETLAGSASSRAQALSAQVKLAEMHLRRKEPDAANSWSRSSSRRTAATSTL